MNKEDLLKFGFPTKKPSIIKVLGIGGSGSNAVNHMFKQGICDVDFVICNTDVQDLAKSPVTMKIQLGQTLTEGLGAGSFPEQGKQAAIESLNEIISMLSENTRMVFITAGMGGGTGTGAAPVIAKAAKELGLLTIAIVTIPFHDEGPRKFNQAIEGIRELKEYVDSLLVINNEKIREIYGDQPLSEAFAKADDVLAIAARGIAEIITVPGNINVDFADVKTVMSNSGIAIMGTGIAEGENRALEAIKKALSSPLLNNNEISGAKNILLNITSGENEITIDELGQITNFVQQSAGSKADMIFGSCKDDSLGNKISVTIIATGFGSSSIPELDSTNEKERKVKFLGRPPQKEISKPGEFSNGENNKTTQKDVEFKAELKVKTQQLKNNTIFKVEKKPENTRSNDEKNNILTDLGDSEKIDKLENEPAYIRKQLIVDDKNYSDVSEKSNYSISKDGNGVRLSENNPYLYDNVD
ncbi:MAG: cell division protein FtsZ [Bacteroidetes bacterium CG23_combo_of_CG06-09_8_20_14_all_32_9]|nr:MAG: cell division protein FtsZ [Bacteroidetes bacterium CG23_combo_of_CG06-09_8_20_14_all_32_9]